jgi:hypothetical protein
MGKVLFWAISAVLLGLFRLWRGCSFNLGMYCFREGVLRCGQLDAKLILINYLGREFQFGT